MPFVPAICTQCGAQIEVDNTHEAGVCKHCGTAFITEKAINNYTTHVTNNNNFAGATVHMHVDSELEQKITAAETFERMGEKDKARNIWLELMETYPQEARVWLALLRIDTHFYDIDTIPFDAGNFDFKKVSWRGFKKYKPNPSYTPYSYLWNEYSQKYYDRAYLLSDDQTKNQLEQRLKVVKEHYNHLVDSYIKEIENFDFKIEKDIEQCSFENLIKYIGDDLYVYEDAECYSLLSILQEKRKFKISVRSTTPGGGSETISYSSMDPVSLDLNGRQIYLGLDGDLKESRAGGHIDYYGDNYDGCIKLNHRVYQKSDNPAKDGERYRELKKIHDKKVKKEANGCYIATCVYGSYDCPQVWTLRRFRDNTLDETWYGRLFIRCYYAVSPTLVKWLGEQNWFRGFWKKSLDVMVSKLNHNGVEDSPYHDKY